MAATLRGKAGQLLAAVRANTVVLEEVCHATSSQRRAEATTLARKQGLLEDELDARKTAVSERHALVEAVNTRASAVRLLQARIRALQSKDHQCLC